MRNLAETMTDTERGETIDTLLGMRSLLSEPGTWTQGTLAQERYETQSGTRVPGFGVSPTSPRAEMWCLVGAAVVTSRLPATNHPVQRYLRGLLRRRYDWRGSVQSWNDDFGRTVCDVLGLIDTAIEELKNAETKETAS